jgi:Family of unknown function (DUF6350)
MRRGSRIGRARFGTMRDVTVQLERPRTQGAPATVLRSPLASGAVGAIWASALGLAFIALPVVLAWVLAPHGEVPAGDALRGGVLAWLAAQHATIGTSAGPLNLVPLGLLAVPAYALYRSGRWAGRASVDALPAAVAATATLTAAYVTAVAVVTSLTSDARLGAEVRSVVLGSMVVALVAGGAGVISGGRLWSALADLVPESVPQVLRGAVAGLAVLLGGGALLLTASMVWHFDRVLGITRALQAGAFGGLLLLVLGLLCVPTGVVWAAAYAVGPGFALGIGTTVAPAGVALGPVPAFPLIGGLPATGPAPTVSLVALGVPLVAGLVVGVLAARRPAETSGQTVTEALAAGVLAGLLLGVLAWLSSGSLGAVRMSELGPDGFKVGAVAALEVGVLAAAVAWEVDRHAEAFARAARRIAGLADIVRQRGRSLSPPGRSRLGRRQQPAGTARRVD